MSRPLPQHQRSVVLRLLRGETDAAQAATELGLSHRSLLSLRQRYLRSKLPAMNGSVTAPLSAAAHIRRDHWGVAHVEATSLSDAYCALGYAMAQDRLWQLDHMRRLAHGQLAEILEPTYLRQDRLHRTIGLTRSAKAAAAVMPQEVRQVLEAMTEGINTVMDVSRDNLPLEFELLQYDPSPWTPVDSIAIWKWRWWMLTGRLDVLAQREAVKRHLPPDLIDVFLAVEAGEETIVPSTQPAGVGGFDTGEGSNNWVVGGSRSHSGKPILATDPHNGIDLSRQWYQAQITAPDGDGQAIDAIGAFFLGTPGIYMGTTRYTAWGITNHTASARDLYIETGAAEFETTTETIAVRGAADDSLEIRHTARGPVVTEFVAPVGDDEPPILSLRWVGAEATTGFESMLALIRSRSVDDVIEALREWPFPILNFLFADASGGHSGHSGRVGYHAVGRVPKRQRATYGFKRADEPLDQWDSMVAFDDMPHAIDPARDWLASANNPPWARDDPYMRSGNWADGYRALQIRARIEARQQHDIDSVGAIHADVVIGRAQLLAPVLADIALAGPNRSIRALGEILQDWDGAYTVDTPAPTVFTAFWEQWLLRVALMRFPARAAGLVASKAGAVAASILLGDDAVWCPAGTDTQQEVLAALHDTRTWLHQHIGPRRSQWRWGRLHTVLFRHPVADLHPGLAKLLNIGPFETSGGTGTVRAAGVSTAKPFVVTGLSTYRLVVDLANPGHAMATSAGGQSGHVASRNYHRQPDLWLKDEYHPLLMDRADIDQNLAGTLRLVPST